MIILYWLCLAHMNRSIRAPAKFVSEISVYIIQNNILRRKIVVQKTKHAGLFF